MHEKKTRSRGIDMVLMIKEIDVPFSLFGWRFGFGSTALRRVKMIGLGVLQVLSVGINWRRSVELGQITT